MTPHVELAIVGAGMAGLAAAISAAARGVAVTLIDAGDTPGGQTALQTHEYAGTGLRGAALGARLWREAAQYGVALLPRTVAWGLFVDRTLGLAINHGAEAERGALLRADAVLVATGAVDRIPVFPGATLPGVLTATAALTMLHRWCVRPGASAFVVGNDPITAPVAQYARDAGLAVTIGAPADDLRADAGADGALACVTTGGMTYNTQTLILAAGMQPACELARMVACDVTYSEPLGGWVPTRDARMGTSLAWLFVAGDAAGVGDAGSAMEQGSIAGNAIADMLGKAARPPAPRPFTLACGAFRRPLPAVWDAARGGGALRETLLCRCEEVTGADVAAVLAAGTTTVNDAKRRTRAGMGMCQGRWCAPALAAFVAAHTGRPVAALAPLTARPPVCPVSLGVLADTKASVLP